MQIFLLLSKMYSGGVFLDPSGSRFIEWHTQKLDSYCYSCYSS